MTCLIPMVLASFDKEYPGADKFLSENEVE